MSQTSAGGSGGAVTPGWYTDPHDPRQLRWWSGEGWTEHVSPGSGGQQAAEQAVQAPAVQALAVQAPAAQAPAAQAPAAQAPAAQEPGVQDPGVQAQATDPSAPLPSRRALRDPATEASEAAEAALAGQAAAQAQQAQVAAQQAAFAAPQAPVAQPEQAVQPQQPVQAVQPQQAVLPDQQQAFAAPGTAQTASVPTPTLPVAPTSFLEQQGYAPLDGAASEPNGWGQPAAAVPSAQAAPVAPAVQPVQAVAPEQLVQPAQTLPPVEQAAPNAWNQPTQPAQPAQAAQPNAWNQPVQPEQPEPTAAPAQPNAWNQPVQAEQPVQQGWAAAPTAPAATEGMDSLFGGAAAGQAPAQDAQSSQWGLTPTDGDSRASRRGAEPAGVAGSSSFWAWLIAISPILAAGAITYVLLTTKSALTAWPFEAAVAAPFLLVLLFALGDRAVLLQLGHTQPRSPAWALLTAPVYLIARAGETRREDGSGTALTLVWFVSFLVAIGGIIGYGFLTHHALIAGLPT